MAQLKKKVLFCFHISSMNRSNSVSISHYGYRKSAADLQGVSQCLESSHSGSLSATIVICLLVR